MRIGNSIAAALVLLFITHSARAVDPNQPFSSYIQTRFTDDEGLASNIVTDTVQTQDGFLWITFGNGAMTRFDGQHAVRIPITTAGALTIGPNGDLWVGGTELRQIPAATFKQYSPQVISHHADLGTDNRISSLRFSRSGILWVGTNKGLYRFENGVFSSVIPQLSITRIAESSNGNLLIITSQGFMVWDGSRAMPHPELSAQLGIKATDVFHVFEDSRGVTWICTALGVARSAGGSIEKLQPWGSDHGVFRAYEDPQSNIWMAGSEGLFRATASGPDLVVKGMKVRTTYGDRDGNLWVSTNGGGLYRFKDRVVRMFTKADGLPASNLPMTVLTAHDGTLWAGYNCGGLVRFDGHGFRTYSEKDGLLNSCVFALAEDANHDLWIGTFGGGVFRFHNDRFTQYSTPQGLKSSTVLAVLAARDGSMWFATPDGLSCLRNGQFLTYTVADGLSSNHTFDLYQDRRGDIWVGTESGVSYLHEDQFVKISSTLADLAWPIGEDSKGTMYVALRNGGLFRFDKDELTRVIPDAASISLIETDQGDLWLTTAGIMRAPSASLRQSRAHDEPVDFAIFGLADGMSSIQCVPGHPDLALTPDGKLWAATVAGLAMIDLNRLRRTDRKPAIHMEEFTVGRNQQLPGEELVLPAGTSHTELRFNAVEITSPEKIRLQYRLDGVDSEWLDAEAPGHAVYSTIPPGTHAFHVRACNRDGIWDRTGMVYLIIQKPFFYQTTWFRVAMIVTGLLLVLGLYRFRLRQATARLNVRFDERLAERTRIARELHDTLLQTIQGSKLIADDALERATEFAHLHGKVEQLSRWLGQATQEGRAALNSLRTSSVETNDLAAALRRGAEACLLNTSSIDLKFSVTGGPTDMHPIPRDEIYRIGYEAIRNACEHSSASKLEVALDYARDLTLRVKDNGVGIPATVLTDGKAGHFGLQGMRERAERIQSKLTLVSSPDSGTEITLVVPGNVVFRKSSATRLDKLKTFFVTQREQ